MPITPVEILKNQIANLIGENARLFCEVHNLTEEIHLLRKQLAEATIKREEPNLKAVKVAEVAGVKNGVDTGPT